jgi:transcriptional/translational regulatory protein YebC/TACO1
MFDRVGIIGYSANRIAEDKMLELAIEAGANDVETFEGQHSVITSISDFTSVRGALASKLGEPESAKITWIPKNTIVISDTAVAEKIMKLVEKLEEDDDVQEVVGNFDILGQ